MVARGGVAVRAKLHGFFLIPQRGKQGYPAIIHLNVILIASSILSSITFAPVIVMTGFTV
jgi:hypothetical protein